MKKISSSFRIKNATILSTESQKSGKKQGIINYIDPTIITYISKVHHEKERPRKIASLNELDNKESNINNGLNDNIHVDTDKKSKARRSLLYLLNIMSGGTFCPEINSYFNELREMKIKENQEKKENKDLPKLEKEEINHANNKEFSIKNPIKRIQSLREQLLNNNKQSQNNTERFNYHFKKREKENENEKINEKDENLQIKTYTNDFGLKDFENYYSLEEIEKNTQTKFSFTLNKQTQARNKLFKKEDDEKLKKLKKGNFENKKINKKKISKSINKNFNNNNSNNQNKNSNLKKKNEEKKSIPTFFNAIKGKINEMKEIGEIKEEAFISSNS